MKRKVTRHTCYYCEKPTEETMAVVAGGKTGKEVYVCEDCSSNPMVMIGIVGASFRDIR